MARWSLVEGAGDAPAAPVLSLTARKALFALGIVGGKVNIVFLEEWQSHKVEKVIDTGTLLLGGLVERRTREPAPLFVNFEQRRPLRFEKVPQIVRAVEHPTLDLRIPEQQAPNHFGHDLDVLAQRTATDDLASIPGGGK
jgi:hypothetical protein